ncbi:MAG: 23S rRNA (pseudouridine(1915)-N(3))-methyltransferase RlmH [Acidobacteriota bacterium]|nr:MAG: 23S rRNA (pseudouridine(1915)-N(3))-methyltransferase RlmH [Acidobacteriota bacterium]
MRFTFVWVGKTRNKHLLALQEDYLARLSKFADCSIGEVREFASAKLREDEGKRILEKLRPGTFVCVLDEKGKQETSKELAGRIQGWQERSVRDIVFVIGGAEGVSAAVAERADHRLSLSFLTFTHEMARVFLLEQLYRAFTILKGFPYQK